MTPGTVYVIQSGKHYKIGRTTNLTHRLGGLRTGSPVPVKLIYQLVTPDSDGLERALHQQFAHLRAQVEWFRLTKAELARLRLDFAMEPPPLTTAGYVSP
jgi:hypothetical protein